MSSFIPEPSAKISRLFYSPALSFLPLLPCFSHFSLFIRSSPTAVRPWGMQMCQLISFPLSVGSLPLVQLGQVREPAEQTQSDTNRSKREQQHATNISSFSIALLNESPGKVRMQLCVVTVQIMRARESVRKMNRTSWHRPWMALPLCPIKAVIYGRGSSTCDLAQVQTRAASSSVWLNLADRWGVVVSALFKHQFWLENVHWTLVKIAFQCLTNQNQVFTSKLWVKTLQLVLLPTV